MNMKILKLISKTRRHLSKHKTGWAIFVGGWITGLILTPSTFDAAATLFHNLSVHTLSLLCLSFILFLCITIAYIILLKSDLKRHQKYLKQHAPALDIDSEEEYDEGWDAAAKDEKIQMKQT